jgi:hypothetical protein
MQPFVSNQYGKHAERQGFSQAESGTPAGKIAVCETGRKVGLPIPEVHVAFLQHVLPTDTSGHTEIPESGVPTGRDTQP